MKNNLVIITNEKFYKKEKNFYCDHIAEKTLIDNLNKKFCVTVVGRKSKITRAHELSNQNIKYHSFFILYFYAVFKKILQGNTKFLFLAISPYTFFTSLLFIFSRSKPIIYLRSDGHQEYRSILGFYGPIIYGLMFNVVAKIGIFISCRKYILKKQFGHLAYPSEITKDWMSDVSKPNFDKIKLLYVGRLKVEKGIFSLIKLIKKLSNHLELTIVGESKQSEKISSPNIQIFPIENDVRNLIKRYDDCNIFILPSFTEGHPMVLFEALSRMRPVIIFEEIQHIIGNKRGIFISERNSQSLEKTIEHIKKNHSMIYDEMKNNQLPTKDQFIKQFEDLILSTN